MTNGTVTDAQRPPGAPQTNELSAEELRGTSAGVTVCAVMGLTWAAAALGGLDTVLTVPVLIAGVAIATVLMRGARRLRRLANARSVPTSPRADLGPVRRRFNLVVAGECVTIGVATNLLVRTDHPRWIPTVICAVVGLHFVPLARLFRVPLYYATAAVLCLVAATTIIVGAFGGPESIWQMLPGFGAALALWATGTRLLTTTKMTELEPLPTRPGSEQHAKMRVAASSVGRPGGLALAQMAGIVGVTFAAISIYWGLGGTWLLSTISGSLSGRSHAGHANLLVGAWIPAILKLAAAVVPLLAVRQVSRSRPTRLTWATIVRVLAWLEAGFLTLYGLVLTGVGLLVQADVIQPSAPDHRALAWHAFLWDPWFLVWGLLVLAALLRSRQFASRLPPAGRPGASPSSARPAGAVSALPASA